MATITRKVIARGCIISVAPMTLAGNVLTAGTAIAMTGRAGRVVMTHRNQTEDISGNDALNENHVILKKGWRLSIEQIKHIAGPELEDLAMANDYFQVTITSPRFETTDKTATRVYVGTMEEHAWPIEPGKNLDTINLLPVDIGTSNPSFAVA